jgi:hypothetical protein
MAEITMNDQFQQQIETAMPIVYQAIVKLAERHRAFFERVGIFEIISEMQSRKVDDLPEIAAIIRLTICQAQAVALETLPFWQVIDAINFFDDARLGREKWKYMTDAGRFQYLAWAIELAQESCL